MELEIRKLVRDYGTKRVLDLESVTIEKGTRTAIIGPNGAGKSTLLNIVSRIDVATEGEVVYESEDPRLVTQVFQQPYMLRTSVERNIQYPLRLRNWPEEGMKKRSNELMEDLGLLDLRHQKAWKLSGGETQKVALARALSFQPSLLLLDEPTANIDPATTAEIEEMLLKINREEGTTILFVTHNLAQARRVCNRLLFLDKGKLVESGDCQEILQNPKEEKTRRFIAGELLI
jgi:tungstate transport system ATP-binding protein